MILSRLVDADGWVSWVVYFSGQYTRPIAILTDTEMDRMIKQHDDLVTKAEMVKKARR
jgi:hypothetical protein